MPGGVAEPQGQVVQGGGQLPSVRGVGQGRAAGQAPGCFLPDMLVVAAEGLMGGCGARGKSIGAPADRALALA